MLQKYCILVSIVDRWFYFHIVSYLRTCVKRFLQSQSRSQGGSPEEIRVSSDNERKRVAAIGSYCALRDEVIPHKRTYNRGERHGVGPVQFWFGELTDQGYQHTGKSRKRGKTQVAEIIWSKTMPSSCKGSTLYCMRDATGSKCRTSVMY